MANGDYEMVGTFNGNPLSMPPPVRCSRRWRQRMPTAGSERSASRDREELEAAIAETGRAAHVVSVGAKGCVTFSAEPVRDYRDFLDVDDRYNHAHWLCQHNGGVFLPPWGKTEQWLISVQHEEDDVERFVVNFCRFAAAVHRCGSPMELQRALTDLLFLAVPRVRYGCHAMVSDDDG